MFGISEAYFCDKAANLSRYFIPRLEDKTACFTNRVVSVRLSEPCYDLQAYICKCVVFKSAIFVL